MSDTVTNQGDDINGQQINASGDMVAHDSATFDQHGQRVGNQINVAGNYIESATPPILSLHQLPPPPADFTGRTADLDAILNDIEHGASISGVRGMGGIGKTALALVIADRLKAQYPDAQFFLSLRGASDAPVKPVDAMQSVIRAYHPTAQLPDDATQIATLYRSVLDGQRAIVMLDDANDAAQITSLLPPKSCLVLVTTRNTFTVPGLRARKLELLSPADARNLLIAIAPHLNDVVADEIARLCGYLPLALRAAASLIAATTDLNPLAYASQLRDERTRITKIGKEGVEIDVEASLNLSYAQLSPEAAQVFRQLSVFPATFDAAAEEAVCEEADHARLSQLLRLNLVQYDETASRYSLHDLTRLFAAAHLAQHDDEGSATHFRHAAYYREILATSQNIYLRGSDTITHGLALFDREWLNIRAGQAWAADNLVAEQTSALDDPMSRSHTDEAARLCNGYANNWHILNIRLHPRKFIDWLESGVVAARELQLENYEGAHLGNLGIAYKNLGQMRRAIEYHEQSLKVKRKIGDKKGEGNSLGNLGLIYASLGETRRAFEFYEQALIIAREIGDRRGEGIDLGNLGLAYASLGETRRAIEFYKQHCDIAREIGDRRGESAALGNLGNAYYTIGDGIRAIKFYTLDLAIVREIGDQRGEGDALGNLGIAYDGLGETLRAIGFYEQQLVIVRTIGYRLGESIALWNMALALDKLGERVRAIACAEAALKIKEQIEDPRADKVRQQLTDWKEAI